MALWQSPQLWILFWWPLPVDSRRAVFVYLETLGPCEYCMPINTASCSWARLWLSLLFHLRPKCGGGNEDNGNLLQNIPCTHCSTRCPWPFSRPPPTHASARDSCHSQTSLGQSLLGTLLLSPGSWCTQSSVCALQVSVSPVLWQFYNQIPLTSQVLILWRFSVLLLDAQVGEICFWSYNFLNSVRISL